MTSFFDLRSDRDICTSRIHFPDLPAPGRDEYSVFKHIPVQAGTDVLSKPEALARRTATWPSSLQTSLER